MSSHSLVGRLLAFPTDKISTSRASANSFTRAEPASAAFGPFWLSPLLHRRKSLDRIAPRAGADPAVRTHQIGPGNLEIQDGLTLSLTLGRDNLASRVLVGSLQTGPLASGRIHAVIGPAATAAADQTLALLHFLTHREDRRSRS